MILENLPRKLPLSAYAETREAVIDKYSRIDGIRAVIEYGTIPLPGISDMDFIVVAKPGARFVPPRMGDFTEQQRFVMSHRPFILSDSVHARHRTIDPWILHAIPIIGDEKRYGIAALDTLSAEEHAWASFRRMLQWSNGFLRFIANVRCNGVCSTRSFLDHCIGIKYFYRELAKMGLAGEEDDRENVDFFVSLRDEWFSRSDEENALLMEDGVVRFSASLHRFLDILAKHFATIIPRVPLHGAYGPRSTLQRALLKKFPRSLIVDTDAEVYVYRENCPEIALQYETFRSLCPLIDSNGCQRFICVLPLSLCCICTNYLEGNGPVSDRFRSAMCTDLSEIPIAGNPFMKDFVAMTNRSMSETATIPLKGLFETYGYEWTAPGWKNRVYMWYALWSRILTSSRFGRYLSKRSYSGTLSSFVL